MRMRARWISTVATAAVLLACSNGTSSGGGLGGAAGASHSAGGAGGTDAAAPDGAHSSGGAAGSSNDDASGGSSAGGTAGATATDAGGGSSAGGSTADAGGGTAGASGAHDAGSDAPATTDPFDPASCPGQPLTETQAAQFFQAGATQAVIGSYTIEMRKRDCNPVTGCDAWGSPTTATGAALGGGEQEMSGTILLNVQGSSVVLALQDATEEKPYSMGATCSAVDGTSEACGAYEYDMGDQWGGSGGLFPTMAALIDVNDANVTLSGVLTKSCLRLAYAAVDSSGNQIQQFVLFAPVSAGAPLPPDPCPGGGTQMACGSQAPGQTTCCQNGLITCPQSGCDCWGACG
jgi:hypothetical protein